MANKKNVKSMTPEELVEAQHSDPKKLRAS